MTSGYSDEEWLGISFHEAGHAVAGMLASRCMLGDYRGTKQVMLGRLHQLPSPLGNGRVAFCEYDPSILDFAPAQSAPNRTRSRIYVARAIWRSICCLAGPYAELRHYGVSTKHAGEWTPELRGGSDQDFEFARYHYKFADGMKRPGLMKIHEQTYRLVDYNFQVIERVAAALFDAGHLTNGQLVELAGLQGDRMLSAA